MEYREVKLAILRVIRKRKGRGAAGRDIISFLCGLKSTWKGVSMTRFLDRLINRELLA